MVLLGRNSSTGKLYRGDNGKLCRGCCNQLQECEYCSTDMPSSVVIVFSDISFQSACNEGVYENTYYDIASANRTVTCYQSPDNACLYKYERAFSRTLWTSIYNTYTETTTEVYADSALYLATRPSASILTIAIHLYDGSKNVGSPFYAGTTTITNCFEATVPNVYASSGPPVCRPYWDGTAISSIP